MTSMTRATMRAAAAKATHENRLAAARASGTAATHKTNAARDMAHRGDRVRQSCGTARSMRPAVWRHTSARSSMLAAGRAHGGQQGHMHCVPWSKKLSAATGCSTL